jgi:uncharacterized phage infection (PIP) family protein YhgE
MRQIEEEDLDFFAASKTQVAPPVEEPEAPPVEVEVLPGLPAIIEYETQQAVTRIYQFEQKVNRAIANSKKITAIRDEATNALSATAASEVTRLIKDIETVRKHFTAPHTKFNQKVNEFAKKYSDPLGKEQARQKMMLTGWHNAQEMEKRRKEAAAREEQRKAQAEVDAEAQRLRDEAQEKVDDAKAELERLKTVPNTGATDDQIAALEKTIEEESVAAAAETPMVAFPVVAEQDKVVRTLAGSASFAHDFTWELEDISLVDRKWLVVDDKKVTQAVKGGLRNEPGFKIFDRTTAKIKA